MVSARPSPNPARGRISYPSAATYSPGDASHSPAYLKGSEPLQPMSSRDSDGERAQGLKTWWKTFRDKPETLEESSQGVFGVPLADSIQYAAVQISTQGKDGKLHVWGVVPIIVAKCGLYLKEHATDVEGTFRISGSSKRMRDLQVIFDTGPKYGKNIDWEALPYTTHDVATIFRRFLTQMPEPIVPYSFYEAFRQAFDPEKLEETRSAYRTLIGSLPPVNRYLLLYVLDLLHVFARKADTNLMTAANLALIFQPGVLSHPDYAMNPREHVLSQQVLEFLIDQQDAFLLDMPSHEPSEPADEPEAAPKPTMTKVAADSFEQSDSDDDAPSGGYYMIETPRTLPKRAKPKKQIMSDSAGRENPSSGQETRSAGHEVRSAGHGVKSSGQDLRSPANEMVDIEPSDSDDDIPPGGYSIREGNPVAHQATLLGRSPKDKVKSSSRVVEGAGLSRRRTVPARLLGGSRHNRRKDAKEAP